ncbi:zinc finger protein 27 [Cherax quadricarinatus]
MMNEVENMSTQHLLSLQPHTHVPTGNLLTSTGHVTGSTGTLEGGGQEGGRVLEQSDVDPLLLCQVSGSHSVSQRGSQEHHLSTEATHHLSTAATHMPTQTTHHLPTESTHHLPTEATHHVPTEPTHHLPTEATHHHLPPDATLTYATLDAQGNIVLQHFKSETQNQATQQDIAVDPKDGTSYEVEGIHGSHRTTTGAPRLVVVGEGGPDAMTYIYIQGEGEAEAGHMESRDAHTITLNSADGSTLQTLPAAYTQHLEHTYGDLVLVGSDGGSGGELGDRAAVSATIGEVTAGDSGGQQDEQVLLLSVAPLKLEENGGRASLSLPTCSSEVTSTIVGDIVPVGRGRREGGRREEKFPDDEMSTIEARLATRDSLLPPRRHRRCGDPGKLTCPICHTQFKSGRQYHGHLHVHRGQGIWHCDICVYTCDSAVELRLHKAELHQDARPFKCPTCHLSFPKNLMLEDHIRSVHNKERPYTCSFCTKGFYRPHDLKMHLNLHLGIKSNVCHVCGRQFSHPSNLIRHHRLHTGIKPYVCATCGKRFTQVTLLHKHRTSHQPGAGVCPLCPSTFRSAAGLRKHSKLEHKKPMTLQEAARIIRGQRSTTGRSYYCSVCGAQFSVKSELKTHDQQEHSKSTKHPCASCNKVYSVAEVKTHTCLTAEEEEQRNRVCSPQHSTSPESRITAVTSTSTLRSPCNTAKGLDDAEEEEEYLVMYITPEGESVSYVMKKGSKISEVLQVNATQPDQLNNDGFPRPTLPEETIMINVQDRPSLAQQNDNQATEEAPQVDEVVLTPQDRVTTTTDLPNDDNPDSVLPLHSIKLEPQTSEDIPKDTPKIPNKSLVPVTSSRVSQSPKTEKPANLRALSIKTKVEELEIKEENSESVTDTKPQLVCNNCGKAFHKQWNFQQHIATHDASLHRYKCGMCSLTFAYRSTLNKHMDKHRPTSEVHQCKECDKTYKYQASLKQHHKRDHVRHRPYACNLCGKDFFSKSDYKYHMRVHKKEQPYMCFACGREFSHISHLHRHERVHTGERPHKCPLCPKKFIQLVTLKIHLKKHEKKAPEESDIIGNSGNFSENNVGINLAMGGNMVSDSSTIVGLSHSMCNEDGAQLSAGTNAASLGIHTDQNSLAVTTNPDSLVGEGDSATAVDRSVVGDPASTLISPELTEGRLPPGTIILAQGDLNNTHDGGQFVTGMDGECIAIFVQETLE